MHIVVDKTNLKMVAAAASLKWANLIAYVDFGEVATCVVDSEDGRTWTVLDKAQMATLYTNMSGQPSPEYKDAIEQLRAYSSRWPLYPKTERDLEPVAEAIYQAEMDDPEIQLHAEETATALKQEAFQATVRACENARPAQSSEHRAEAQQQAATKPKAPPSGEGQPRPRQGITKKIWEYCDIELAVTGQMGDHKAFRRRVVDRVKAEHPEANEGTIATQFGHWRRERGL